MTTILTTTGISLYINTGRENNTRNPTKDQMRQYLRKNPKRSSSEANSLLQMSDCNDHLVLLHTQTPEATQCAELLQEYFSNEGYKHVRLVALEFQSNPKHIETTGLRNLINTIIDQIQKAERKKQKVVINATAGFKAQVVYSTMIGMIYQVPVKYIYEEFQNIVTFNPIAVGWDTSLFFTYDTFFKWVDAEPRSQAEVEKYLKDYPDKERIKALLTSPDDNGEVFLSYMGEALRRKFRGDVEKAEFIEWPPAANVKHNDDKIASSILNRNHHPVDGDLAACRKIATIDCVRGIIGGFYENTNRTDVKILSDNTIVLLWADGKKASRFTIATTADPTTDKGQLQTLKIAQKIKELLEIQ
jgi:putative CRISPR-associated protein (TIGR02619 family)